MSGATSDTVRMPRPLRTTSSVDGRRICEPTTPFSILVGSLAINLMALGLPLVILQVYDRVLPFHAMETLLFLMIGLAGIVAVDLVLKLLRAAVIGAATARFVFGANEEAMRRILWAPFGTVEKEPVSTHVNRFAALSAIGEFHGGASRFVIIDLPFVTIFLAIMALVGGPLAAIPIVLFFIFAVLALRRSEALRRVIETRSSQDGRKYDFVIEALSGIQTVKSLGLEPAMQRRYERLQQEVAETTYRSISHGARAQTAATLYASISQIAVVACGAVLVIQGSLSMGGLACCTLLSGQILQPLLRGIGLWSELQSVGVKRAEAAALFALPAAVPLAQGTAIDGRIELRGVGFTYPDRTEPSVQDIDLTITAGEIVGFRGTDGSGRSTLMRLVRGDLVPTAGEVRVDGLDPTDPATGLRRHVSYVGQSPLIFRGTILENVAAFRLPQLRESAQEAARLIGLERLVHLLPEGWDTRIGEGVTDDLPTAFGQQISIARALAAGPAVLILDEANTVLDRNGEASLFEALKALRGHITVLIVSHRPSLLACADRIVTLEAGRIVGEERPAEKTVRSREAAP